MKKTIFTLALLLAASTAAFADDGTSDPNPQPKPSTGALVTGCGRTVDGAPAPETFDDIKDMIKAYEKLVRKECGYDANYTYVPYP